MREIDIDNHHKFTRNTIRKKKPPTHFHFKQHTECEKQWETDTRPLEKNRNHETQQEGAMTRVASLKPQHEKKHVFQKEYLYAHRTQQKGETNGAVTKQTAIFFGLFFFHFKQHIECEKQWETDTPTGKGPKP